MNYTVVKPGRLVFKCPCGRTRREVDGDSVINAVNETLDDWPDPDIVSGTLLRGDDGEYYEVHIQPIIVKVSQSHAKAIIGRGNNGCEDCVGTGIHDPASPSCTIKLPSDGGWHIIERCDSCQWFDDDTAAALAYYEGNSVLFVKCDSGASHVAVHEGGRL